jgi:hypothetical protein
LAELLDQDSFGPDYQDLIRQVHATTDPEAKLRFPAKIARQIYETQNSTFDRFRGAGVVAPDLDSLEKQRECHRYEAQRRIITFLQQAGRLRTDLSETAARDILWTLTGREIYRMLVRERGWTSEAYQEWVADMLVASLLDTGKVSSSAKSNKMPKQKV